MKFKQEATQIKGGAMSSYVTSVERLAKEEGLKEGLAHEQKLILKQLQKRFGSVPTEVEQDVKKLDVAV